MLQAEGVLRTRKTPVHAKSLSASTAPLPSCYAHLFHRELDCVFACIRVVHGKQDDPARHGRAARSEGRASVIAPIWAVLFILFG